MKERDSLRFALEIEGFSVRDYAGGAELLSERELPGCDCLVIDQFIPGRHGLSVAAVAMAGVPIAEEPLLSNALLDRLRDTQARRNGVSVH